MEQGHRCRWEWTHEGSQSALFLTYLKFSMVTKPSVPEPLAQSHIHSVPIRQCPLN